AGGTPSAEALAAGVLGADGAALRTLDVRPVRFFCPCSRERAVGALALLGKAELGSLLEEDGGATVECQFCRESYRFAPGDVASPFGEAAQHLLQARHVLVLPRLVHLLEEREQDLLALLHLTRSHKRLAQVLLDHEVARRERDQALQRPHGLGGLPERRVQLR